MMGADMPASAVDSQAAERIDVIIAAWNCSDTIPRAIRSVMQEPVVRSVLVVDDHSSDDTAQRVQHIARACGRVQLIQLDRNQGPSAARNRALDRATAPWVAILDGDDFMRPGRLTRLLSAAEAQDIVADDLIQVTDSEPDDAAGRLLLGLQAPRAIDFASFVDGNINRKGRERQEIGFLKPIIRRAFLKQHKLRYDKSLRLGEDYVLYARALAAGARFRLIPAAGYVAVLRDNSLSRRHSRRDLEALRDADRTLLASPSLSRWERRIVARHARQLDGKIQWLNVIEAAKARDALRFARGFTFSPAVASFVASKLAEQFLVRTGRVLHLASNTRRRI